MEVEVEEKVLAQRVEVHTYLPASMQQWPAGPGWIDGGVVSSAWHGMLTRPSIEAGRGEQRRRCSRASGLDLRIERNQVPIVNPRRTHPSVHLCISPSHKATGPQRRRGGVITNTGGPSGWPVWRDLCRYRHPPRKGTIYFVWYTYLPSRDEGGGRKGRGTAAGRRGKSGCLLAYERGGHTCLKARVEQRKKKPDPRHSMHGWHGRWMDGGMSPSFPPPPPLPPPPQPAPPPATAQPHSRSRWRSLGRNAAGAGFASEPWLGFGRARFRVVLFTWWEGFDRASRGRRSGASEQTRWWSARSLAKGTMAATPSLASLSLALHAPPAFGPSYSRVSAK